jgi:hypothetical protein
MAILELNKKNKIDNYIMAERNTIGYNTCLDRKTIENEYGGTIVENPDGTVSVYIPSVNQGAALPLSKTCCQFINPNYTFDIENQVCRYKTNSVCSLDNAFKLVLNPKGNDGSVFYVEDGDNCTLNVEFDFLFKVKCETLSNILKGIQIPMVAVPIKDDFIGELSNLDIQIREQQAKCEEIANSLAVLQQNYLNTQYSIYCANIPLVPTYTTYTGKTKSFGRTAFGSTTAPFGFGLQDAIVAGQNYCLSEPDGLNAWYQLLGDYNYNLFINGDESSFTCKNVQTLFDQNSVIINNNILNNTQTPVYMTECDTPFSTKSDLANEINILMQEQKKCRETLDSLTSQVEPVSADTPQTLINSLCKTPLEMFETFDVSLTLDVITSADTAQLVPFNLQTVATIPLFPAIGAGNLYDYLKNNLNSGFYVCGDSNGECVPLTLNLSGVTTANASSCDAVMNNIIEGLFDESGLSGTSGASDIFISSLPPTALASNWVHFSTGITDTAILELIKNEKIKISLKINHSCGDFCVLIDEISLDKVCTNVDRNDIFLSQSPGFELERIRDNRKSWINNTTLTNRPFIISNNNGNNSIRQTNYDVNDERLVINTKEIDLDINLAKAVETDVWCYISDNPCLLTGVTTCFPCIEDCGSKNFQDDECFAFMDGYYYDFMDGLTTGTTSLFNHANCCGDDMIDFQSLMTQPLSAATTIEDFEYFLTSELIDAKNRQTISGYPTLRALYDRYMNSGLYCGNESSKFDYLTMEQFANLVGNYWVDIVEQVIPATTIWGSVKVYTNTIFDQQKYKYKAYSSLFCGNPFSGQTILSPINGTAGQCTTVSVTTTPIQIVSGDNIRLKSPVTSYCDSLCIAQMNSGSEFIGTVSITGPSAQACDSNGTSINENTLQASVDVNYPTASVVLVGATQPVTYLWSNGSTGQTATLNSGNYYVTITDALCNQSIVKFIMPPPTLSACWYSMQESPEYVINNLFCDGTEFTAVTFTMANLIVNGIEYLTGATYSPTFTSGSTDIVLATNTISSGCTGGGITGLTYTNFVDFLNDTFAAVGLTDYHAQISLVERSVSGSNSSNGFYIIRPSTDTFSINTVSDVGTSIGLSYHEGDFSLWNGEPVISYYSYDCDVVVENGVVIE